MELDVQYFLRVAWPNIENLQGEADKTHVQMKEGLNKED
jgi:hypothetical protein